MKVPKYDFAGWATRNDMRCSDGRTIRKNAFKDDDGRKVPLIWNHEHNDPTAVLGHAILENRDSGVYAYCYLNDTEVGEFGKKIVKHGDVESLSIWANQLRQSGTDVLHGSIKEVSLVLAGANPGAKIEDIVAHSDNSDFEASIWTGENIIVHSDEDDELAHADEKHTPKEVFATLNTDQKNLYYLMAAYFTKDKTAEHSDDDGVEFNADPHAKNVSHADGKTVSDIFETLNDEQKELFYGLIGTITADTEKNSDNSKELEHSDNYNEGDNSEMSHNIFDRNTTTNSKDEDRVLTHSEQMDILADADNYGTLSKAVLAHGITNIEYLIPDAKEVGPAAPRFVNKDNSWVAKVMGKVHKTPFSRIKTTFADITADEARARGYIKGNKKEDEVFTLLKRTTDPQTVYKKQSFEHEDIRDITDFDVVSWVKSEMRMKLDEEIARAILIGDGRQASSNDKIKEDKIRPIWTDDALYCVHQEVAAATGDTDAQKAEAFIDAVVMGMENYEGSGNVDLFISKHMLTACLLLKDKVGHRLYKNVDELATAMMVNSIVPVIPFTGRTRKDTDNNTYDLMGIVVDLKDYNVGADHGGAVEMFSDFDIDYNKEKYLIETRCSGALIMPHSAIALEIKTAAAGV